MVSFQPSTISTASVGVYVVVPGAPGCFSPRPARDKLELGSHAAFRKLRARSHSSRGVKRAIPKVLSGNLA